MNSRTRSLWLNILCAVLVMAAAVLVRLPSAFQSGLSPELRQTLTDEEQHLYLTDPDSYYHARLVRNDLANGHFGTVRLEDGTSWDTLSFYPEGRSAEYQPGLIRLTEWIQKPLHKLFGTNLYDVEFSLSVVLSALTALAACILGTRMSNPAGGVTSGLLVSCASAFVSRTVFGRFDTDMFVLLMDILLILFLSEALHAKRPGNRVLFSVLFASSAALYSRCWTPEGAGVATGAVLLGGLIFVLVLLAAPQRFLHNRRFEKHEPLTLLLCAALSAGCLILMHGTSLLSRITSYTSATTAVMTSSGVFPNLLTGITELSAPDLVPKTFLQWFSGYSRETHTIVNGIGGVMVALLSLGFFVLAFFRCFRKRRELVSDPSDTRSDTMYFCLFAVVLAGGLFVCQYGNRFTEHLAVPAGLTAGALIGKMIKTASFTNGRRRIAGILFAAFLFIAGVASAVSGAVQVSGRSRPSVSDASADTMAWIRENAEDPEAVVLSWWDYGYYYEYESGHPCLWDGATQDGIRGILFSKAMATGNTDLSLSILRMLSVSGNKAVNFLLERTDAPTVFQALWAALPANREDAIRILEDRCGLSSADTVLAESLIHPETPKEAYLLLTKTMMNRIGWFEYYSVWDFTGNAAPPVTTLYLFTPDGQSLLNSDFGKEYLQVRSRSLLWKLFIEKADIPGFTPVFKSSDGLEDVLLFRLIQP